MVHVIADEELVRSGFRRILRAAGDSEVVATVIGVDGYLGAATRTEP